jgi:hypothetical protein
MADERGFEAPLSPDEVEEILEICSPDGVLVGGQALASGRITSKSTGLPI